MSETCKARFVVEGNGVPGAPSERDVLVQCQDGSLSTHPRSGVKADGSNELMHHAWTARLPNVIWLDRNSEPEPSREHECGHTDADHAAGEGAGSGLDGLLRAIFGGGHVPAGFTADPGKIKVPDPEPEPTPDPLAMPLSGLAQMKDVHAAVLGAAAEHRDRATSAGFSETAAEGIAIIFYMKALGK